LDPMGRKRATELGVPGFSFGDVVQLTSATASNLTHWTNLGIIKAGVEGTGGRGHHRRFSITNIVEIELAATMNRYHVPMPLIAQGVTGFRAYHELAKAAWPVDANQQRLTDEQRKAVERAYVDAFIRRDEAHGVTVTKRKAGTYLRSVRGGDMFNPEHEDAIMYHARTWERFLTDTEFRNRHFYGVFVSPDEDTAVIHDGPIDDPGAAIPNTAIVINLAPIVVLFTAVSRVHW
jgi:hypothetical protein